jgi:CRISPR-associated protein Csx17
MAQSHKVVKAAAIQLIHHVDARLIPPGLISLRNPTFYPRLHFCQGQLTCLKTMSAPIPLPGCRHDILGHYLKAIGILRVLAKCAAPEHRDPDAEGWWDMDTACFQLRSPKYPTIEKLVEFFTLHYQPTAVFAAWNKESGTDAAGAKKLGVETDWNIANEFSIQVVSAVDRNKPANKHKLIATEAMEGYRNAVTPAVREAVDAVTAPFGKHHSDHPLFLSKGIAGRAHLWRTQWEYLLAFQKHRLAIGDAQEKLGAHIGKAKARTELQVKLESAQKALENLLPFSNRSAGETSAKGKGTPFFPDAIKSYNIGSGWVEEKYPFSALDYVLAVEGAFAMRGGMARMLGANSKRFAAFPFVFDSGEEMVDDGNEIKGTSSSLWFPLWKNHTSYGELASFISDAQARLPGKEARFSAEFVRAIAFRQDNDVGGLNFGVGLPVVTAFEVVGKRAAERADAHAVNHFRVADVVRCFASVTFHHLNHRVAIAVIGQK